MASNSPPGKPPLSRFQAPNGRIVLVEQQIDQPVRAGAHVADAVAEIDEQALFVDDLVALQLQPDEELGAERSDEQVAVPAGKRVSRDKP